MCRWNLEEGNPTRIGCSDKAGEITNHTTANSDNNTFSVGFAGEELLPKLIELRNGFRTFAGGSLKEIYAQTCIAQ